MDLAALLGWLLVGLRLVAERTESTIDDEFVRFLEVVQNSPELLAWVQSLLEANIPDGALHATEPPESAKAALAGFDWQAVLTTLLPLLLELLRRRGG